MQDRIEWMDVEDVVGWSIGREGGEVMVFITLDAQRVHSGECE